MIIPKLNFIHSPMPMIKITKTLVSQRHYVFFHYQKRLDDSTIAFICLQQGYPNDEARHAHLKPGIARNIILFIKSFSFIIVTSFTIASPLKKYAKY